VILQKSNFKITIHMQHRLIIAITVLMPIITIAQSPSIHLNQLGFYTNAPKIAVITDAEQGRFFILRAHTSDTVFKAALSDTIRSQYSAKATRIADFSAFNKPGNYVLYVKGTDNSYPFAIKNGAQHDVAVASIKGFYYQRVSMPLEEAYAGKWARPAGHPDTAVLIHASAASAQRPAGTKISTPGGWYDAGDYNKYIVNSGITMGTLLSAYEDFASYFDTLRTHIPEGGDKVPDLLNEIIYNLRWMLAMQDPNDGGVYNKCTNADFDGMVMPGVTKLPRYVVQKGTAAVLDFAAVMAQAGRILQKFNKQLPGLSDSCIEAATSAWQWAEKNPRMPYNQNAINQQFSPKITTGGYGDWNFSDEWFWAACELSITRGDTKYLDTVRRHINNFISLPSWENVFLLGYYSLLRRPDVFQKAAPNLIATAKKRLLAFADLLIAHGGDKAYRTIMGQGRRDFVWGSNSVALNQSIVLINAYLQTNNKRYIDPALTNLDYVLGRNATGYCFVTGIGSKSTLHPHHRQSVADDIDEPVPGLLAGGPNPGKQDHCAGYTSNLPAESYLDSDCSYASNEIAINWNAPLVYVSNAMEALQFKAGYAAVEKK
jgi:endoglucanase